jgi:hypothetical protein
MANYIYYNPNPLDRRTGDCVIRALTKLLDADWDTVFVELFTTAFAMKDMMDHNIVWNDFLESCGYQRKGIPDTCPLCYSIADFCDDHPSGKYVVATDSHVVAVVDGNYYDTWDSGDKVPIYYWTKGEAQNATAKFSTADVLPATGSTAAKPISK